MATSNTERQREYREKRSREATRVSLWISNRANARLAQQALAQHTSREKIVEKLLEAL